MVEVLKSVLSAFQVRIVVHIACLKRGRLQDYLLLQLYARHHADSDLRESLLIASAAISICLLSLVCVWAAKVLACEVSPIENHMVSGIEHSTELVAHCRQEQAARVCLQDAPEGFPCWRHSACWLQSLLP